MGSQIIRKLKGWLAGLTAAAVVSGGLSGLPALQAQEKSEKEIIRDLQRRLEALEKQNQQLMEILQRELPRDQLPPAGAVAPASKDDVTKIVKDYLKEEDARKKSEEAERKKKQEEEGFTVGDDLKFRVFWDHGLTAETEDKAFRVHVGGRTQYDWVFYQAGDSIQFGNNGVGRVDDSMAFRRARFAIEGSLWEVLDFWMEYDFLNTDTETQNLQVATRRINGQEVVTGVNRVGRVIDTPVPTDLWVQFKKLPVIGNVRIGNQKPPISFEHLTSSRFLNFLERSYAFDAYVGGPDNGFTPGVQVFRNFADDRIHAAAAITKFTQTIFGNNQGDGEYAFTARLGGFPIWEDDGRFALWMGVGYQHADPDFLVTSNRQFFPQPAGQVRLRARTLLRNGTAETHTPLLDIFPVGNARNLLVPEFAAVYGPWTVQGEYFGHWLSSARPLPTSPGGVTQFTQSAYVEVLYFLTGEHRVFNRAIPGFARVVPNENFFLVKGDCRNLLGRGAWQVGLRYSWIDLADKGIIAGNNTIGSAQSLTLGLNWFLNPNMKLQWNYTYEARYQVNRVPANSPNGGLFPALSSDGDLQGFGMRMAIDF